MNDISNKPFKSAYKNPVRNFIHAPPLTCVIVCIVPSATEQNNSDRNETLDPFFYNRLMIRPGHCILETKKLVKCAFLQNT